MKTQTTVQKPTHHPFSPSQLGRIALCPASYRAAKAVGESPETEDMAEGTRLHAIMAGWLRGEALPEGLAEDDRALLDRCMDYFLKLKGEREGDPELLIETRFEGYRYDGGVLTAGTPDVVLVWDDYFVTVDWKFGQAEIYSELARWQVKAQAWLVGNFFARQRGRGLVYQARFGHEHFEDFDDIEPLHAEIVNVRMSAERPGAEFRPGPAQCAYCPAKPTCPALREEALVVAEVQTKLRLPSDPMELGQLRDRLKLAEKAIEGALGEMSDRVKRGDLPVPSGYREVKRQGSRKLEDSRGAYQALKAYFRPDEWVSISQPPKVTTLESEMARRLEVSKKEAARELETRLGDLLQRGPETTILQRTNAVEAERIEA